MRLIDADELIKRIGKWMPKDPCGREQTVEEIVATDIAASVCMEIEEMPTAFDKEKVIEKIKDESSSERFEDVGISGNVYGHILKEVIETEEAIEIVEKGGIE